MDNGRRHNEIFRGGEMVMDWELILESMVLNAIEQQVTEQLKKKYGNNVKINIKFNSVRQPKNKTNKKFDRVNYRIECERRWRK